MVGRGRSLQRPAARGVRARAESLASVATDDPNLVLDTIKRAEDSRRAIVLRLYEAHGARGRARVRVGAPFGEAGCEPARGPGATLEVEGDAILVPYRPHEIVTLGLR